MTDDIKVINLGFPKSGTTTLGKALSRAGFDVADWRIRRDARKGTAVGFVGNLMYHGYYTIGDPLALMSKFNAFSEIDIVRNGLNLWPQTDWGLISAIRAHHPNARFVLTTRDPLKQSDSMRRWSDLGSARIPQNDIPGLPSGYGQSDAHRVRWIEGHVKFCRQVFADAEDFLEIDIEDTSAPDKLSGFLEIDIPWWGVANRNTSGSAATENVPALQVVESSAR